jgi:RNA polymerase sigma-70 factor (ECF subfamily)
MEGKDVCMSDGNARIRWAQTALDTAVSGREGTVDDETRLIQLAQKGNAGACASLYDLHYGAVYRYCYYRVGDEGLAEDLASEVFMRMVERLDRYQVRGRPLLAWLYTIARNLVIDAHRRRGRASHVSLAEEAELTGDGKDELITRVDRRIQAGSLAAAMKHLTEEQRQVILLKFMEDMSNPEIARILGKSVGSVKSLQHRALGALRREMKRERRHET